MSMHTIRISSETAADAAQSLRWADNECDLKKKSNEWANIYSKIYLKKEISSCYRDKYEKTIIFVIQM